MLLMRLVPTRLVALVTILLAGCATPLPEHDHPDSSALPPTEEGLLNYYVKKQPANAADQSGFMLLETGADALAARLLLIDLAQSSIDLQYYIYAPDTTGLLIGERLLAAAQRGVRVRVLLDDIGSGMSDRVLATLDRHPNIEVRLFNPVSLRHDLFKFPSKVLEFGRINNRMHNKLLLVDNLALITGGRNIGDEYFTLSERDFQDIDILGVGPVSAAASSSFDAFWNSVNAIPVKVIHADAEVYRLPGMQDLMVTRREQLMQEPYLKAVADSRFSNQLVRGQLPLVWGRADWMADPPAKADASADESEIPYLGLRLVEHAREVESELLIISAYFIPGDEGVQLLLDLRQRGADVSILTNSLATTDVLAVHSHYARYRQPLLEAGVRLWELQPMAVRQEEASPFLGDSLASLHAKSFVFDRDRVFVGSINLDPRSISLNTEAGVMVYQPELASNLSELFQRWTAQDYAYSLRLNRDNQIRWLGNDERLKSEPEASPTRRFITWLLGWLPIEDQL